MTVISLRIDRLVRIDRRERDLVMLRAETCWDQDRAVEVEGLGGKLEKDPAVVAEKLKATPQGCDWLIKRWALLAYAADQADGKGWSPEQTSLAFDMLGTPAELRIGRPGLMVDDFGRMVESGSDPATVARDEVARLKEIRAQGRTDRRVEAVPGVKRPERRGVGRNSRPSAARSRASIVGSSGSWPSSNTRRRNPDSSTRR